jgi:hypothetical protein
MRISIKVRPAMKCMVLKLVFGQVLNQKIELGLRVATGALITFAAGLVLLQAETRFGAQVEALNCFRLLATM